MESILTSFQAVFRISRLYRQNYYDWSDLTKIILFGGLWKGGRNIRLGCCSSLLGRPDLCTSQPGSHVRSFVR